MSKPLNILKNRLLTTEGMKAMQITLLKLLLGNPEFQKILLVASLWFIGLFLLRIEAKKRERREKWKRIEL